MNFNLQCGRTGAAADELMKPEQLYPHFFTCLSVRGLELQPIFPLLVPQWSSKLKFKVVLLAVEILVAVSQVMDKAVAKMQRKLSLKNNMPTVICAFQECLCKENRVWNRHFKGKKADVIDIRVFIFSCRTIRVDGVHVHNPMGVFWTLLTGTSMTPFPSLI